MEVRLIRRNGFFIRDGNDDILFLPSPAADFGYVVNEIAEMEGVMRFSRRWGWAEVAGVLLIAVMARHLGPLAMFAGAAASLVGSACLYRAALERMLAGKRRVQRTPPSAAEPIRFGVGALERAATEAPPSLFWISGIFSTAFTVAAIEFAAHVRSADQMVAACGGIVLFGSMAMISAWLLARRRYALAPLRMASVVQAKPLVRPVEKAPNRSIVNAWTEGE